MNIGKVQIVKERIEDDANEKAVLHFFDNCPFVCINFDFSWLNKARPGYHHIWDFNLFALCQSIYHMLRKMNIKYSDILF